MVTAHRIHRLLLPLAVLAAASPEAAAQWSVAAEVSAARFWGGSREGEGNRSYHPYRPTLVGVGIERKGHRVSLGLRGYYAAAGLALEGPDAVVAVKDALDLYGVAAEISVSLKQLTGDAGLMAHAGPMLEVWSLSGESSATRAGVAGAVGLQFGIGGRWSGEVRVGMAVTASPFSRADLEAGFEPRTLWRRAVSGAVRVRL